MESDATRQRAKRKKLRVTFPDGRIFCYANVTDTFISVLCEIGPERFHDINLELCHRPLLAQEIYPRYKDWMKPVCDGWYVNTQSDTGQKYMQLRAINDSLNLGLTVEVGYDFETTKKTDKVRGSKSKEKLLVKFPDGEYIANQSSTDIFLECLWKLGIEDIRRKGVEWGGCPLITAYKTSDRQVQVDTDRWATIPNSTKDKARTIRLLALHFRLNLEITVQ